MFSPSPRGLIASCFFVLTVGSARLPAQGFPDVLYELQEGSVLVADCLCGQPPRETPLRGTMVLKRLPVRILGELYDVKDINFHESGPEPGPAFDVRGKGSYYRRASEPDSINVELELSINETPGVVVVSGEVEPGAPFPALDFNVAEPQDQPRDPLLAYKLRLVARPVSQSWRYDLLPGSLETFEGSFFYNDCAICGRPTIPIPVKGSFVLRQLLGEGGKPLGEHLVEGFSVRSLSPPVEEVVVTATGSYNVDLNDPPSQSMTLAAIVNQTDQVTLESGVVAIKEGFELPRISIFLEDKHPVALTKVYRLDLVADISTGEPLTEFRRGDVNSDDEGDISDAVYFLAWQFSGGPEPTCLEAADTNADARHDLSDAIYVLVYLFQGGAPPPAPGLETCGAPDELHFGCSASPCTS